MTLTDDEKTDLARELDTANDYLLRTVGGEDDVALRTSMAYGVAALCRFAAEAVRPDASAQGDDPNQLKLFPNGP